MMPNREGMHPQAWRYIRSLYITFLVAFPLGMALLYGRPGPGYTVCLFRITTGLDCPGCGLTRAFRAMAHLDIAEATRYNPLGPAIFLVTVLAWGYCLGMVVTGGRLPIAAWWMRWRGRLLWAGITIYLVFGFGRIVYELRHPPPRPIPPPFLTGWRLPPS